MPINFGGFRLVVGYDECGFGMILVLRKLFPLLPMSSKCLGVICNHLPILSLCTTINLGQTSVKVAATLQLQTTASLTVPETWHRSVALPPWRQVLTLWFLGSIFVEVNNQTLQWNKNSEAVQTDLVSKLVGHPFSVIRKRLDHELYIKLSQDYFFRFFFLEDLTPQKFNIDHKKWQFLKLGKGNSLHFGALQPLEFSEVLSHRDRCFLWGSFLPSAVAGEEPDEAQPEWP